MRSTQTMDYGFNGVDELDYKPFLDQKLGGPASKYKGKDKGEIKPDLYQQ